MTKWSEKETVVYRAVNLTNGKKYIGVSCNFGRRCRAHYLRASSKRKQSRFSNAIRKYGIDAFKFEIVSTWPTRAQALQEEMRLIAMEAPEYNITAGGDGIAIEDRSIIPGWYERVSAALKGRKPAEQTMRRARETAHLRAKKTVVCLNDGFFGKVAEAAARYGVKKSAIYSVCSGCWFATKGLLFIESDEPISPDDCVRLLAEKTERRQFKSISGGRARRRPVVRMNDGIIYESVISAANTNGISPMRVVQICKRGGSTQDGRRFAYAGVA